MDDQKILEKEALSEKDEEQLGRLSRTIQKLPTGCAVIQGTEHWELVKGNEEFFRLIGYTEEEIQVLPNDFGDAVYREVRDKLHMII